MGATRAGTKTRRREPEPVHEVLTPRELAAFLGVSVTTAYRLISDHSLPSFRVRGLVRVRRADARRYVEERLAEQGGAGDE
jgi:excisionase family DNA binding protein